MSAFKAPNDVTGYGKSAILAALQSLTESENGIVQRNGRYHGWQLCRPVHHFLPILMPGHDANQNT